MQHLRIWRALDGLAERRGLSTSGLARAAGLDPTTFNKSKRQGPDGKPRWPSTESVARAIDATNTSWEEFARLLDAQGARSAIPIVGMARADAQDLFDAQGFPVGAQETVRLPNLGEERVYALEISGDAMEPLFGPGDIVIVQPGVPVRRGDRVVVRTRGGEMLAKTLGRRNEQITELISVNPSHGAREIPSLDIDWIARIVWASQ